MNRISKEQLELLRVKYKTGTRVKLVGMNDPYTKLEKGTEGTVISVDDIGTIHVSWDSGSCLGIVYLEDKCIPV